LSVVLRQARREDIPAIQRVRRAVRENRLVTSVIDDADVADYLERRGRGWVVEERGEVVGFAIGDATDGNIWALFVDPGYEGRGHGRRLHDAMVRWLWEQGLAGLWLTTDPGTRAERFYRAAGWRDAGRTEAGEVRFELSRAGAGPPRGPA